MLEHFLKQLAADLELEAIPAKDESGTVHFFLNPEMVISIKEQNGQIFFLSKIASCPMQKREQLFILLMKANFLGQGTHGSVIALDPEEKVLTLSLTLPDGMGYHKFKENIEEFANYVDYWREEIATHQKEAENSLY
ncbi:MAG: type III secretion system chaperone [Anaerolineae bacterium]